VEYKVLIVDDEPLARDRIRELLRPHSELKIAGEARNGREAIEAIANLSPDIVFLDIQMPDMDGFEVLKEVKPAAMPFIIFVTAYDQYALRAFEVHAVDYLLKPFSRERFTEAIQHASVQLDRPVNDRGEGRIISLLEELKSSRHIERFAIKVGEKVLFVRSDDVDSIEAEGNYVRLNAAAASYMLRETINSVESQVDPRKFVRIHRSTIVNIDRVKEMQLWARGEYKVILENGASYTLSRGYREHFDHFIKNK